MRTYSSVCTQCGQTLGFLGKTHTLCLALVYTKIRAAHVSRGLSYSYPDPVPDHIILWYQNLPPLPPTPLPPPHFRRLTAQVWNPGARQLVAIAFVVSRTLTGAEIRRATGVFDRCPRMCKRVVLLIDQCSPFSPPQLTSSPHSNQEVIKTDY